MPPWLDDPGLLELFFRIKDVLRIERPRSQSIRHCCMTRECTAVALIRLMLQQRSGASKVVRRLSRLERDKITRADSKAMLDVLPVVMNGAVETRSAGEGCTPRRPPTWCDRGASFDAKLLALKIGTIQAN